MSSDFDNVNSTNLAAGVGTAVTGFVSFIDKRAQQRHKEDKWTLGIPCFIVGCYIPYLCGIHHDPGVQLMVGTFFGIVGAITAGILNCIADRKKRKNN